MNDALVKIQSLESNAEHINSALQAKDIELAALRAQISAPSFEISPNSGSDELHALRDQLAEAEIKFPAFNLTWLVKLNGLISKESMKRNWPNLKDLIDLWYDITSEKIHLNNTI